MRKDNEKMWLVIVVIVIAGLVMMGVILTAMNIKQGGKSDHYDFDCLTTPTKQPLKDCKQ